MQVGLVAEAEQVLRNLQAEGYGPNTVTYNTLLAMYGAAGQLARAEATFQVMREAGFRPTRHSYTALLAAYGKAGRPDKADHCFRQMKVRPPSLNGIVPSLRDGAALVSCVTAKWAV